MLMSKIARGALATAVLWGAAPAMAEDSAGTYDGVLAKAKAAWVEPEGSTATPDQIAAKATYFVGNMAWMTMHEFGHALIAEYSLPVLGKEDDAVDSFATINMIVDGRDEGLEAMIAGVVDAWFNAKMFENDMADEHSVDEQRAYAVVCLLVGADPAGWKAVADESGMTAERQEDCQATHQQAVASWSGLLASHVRAEADPLSEITVVYGAPGDFQEAATLIQATGVLEQVAADIKAQFRLSAPLTLEAASCGEVNAMFSPSDRKITICYELADAYFRKAQQLNDADGTADAAPAGETATDDAGASDASADDASAGESGETTAE